MSINVTLDHECLIGISTPSIRLKCECGYSRGFGSPETAETAKRQHIAKHELFGNLLCKRCHNAPMEKKDDKQCDWCDDQDLQIKLDVEDCYNEGDDDEE